MEETCRSERRAEIALRATVFHSHHLEKMAVALALVMTVRVISVMWSRRSSLAPFLRTSTPPTRDGVLTRSFAQACLPAKSRLSQVVLLITMQVAWDK